MTTELPPFTEACFAQMRSLLAEFHQFASQTARDPAKERQFKSRFESLVFMLYGITLGMSDVGIAPAVLEGNSVMLENWQRVSDAYWSSKGM